MRRRPRHHRLRHRSGKVALGLASPPPEPRRCSSSSSPSDVAIPSSAAAGCLVASSPAPVVVVVVLSSFPVVVASVPPSSRVRSSSAFRQVSCGSPVVVFVLSSASSSVAPAASRLRPRIVAEVVPSPFVSVVPEPSPLHPFAVVVPTPRRVVVRIRPLAAPVLVLSVSPVPVVRLSTPLLSFRRFSKRGSRSSPKVRKAVLSEQGKSHHP
ncbi:cell wall protein-like [Oryza sativa Japonica Group]|uniref:Cell wall protein-like n=1 Tax=Oryza sativa subsp. japonica TaxID=39947 RepID=Q5VNH1_ORYSJ|nr:cell wall protein-like [Oryza sativa Japonica Group]BAD73712.1 cell wall protein-like [Oryza sativa Japonica Group]